MRPSNQYIRLRFFLILSLVAVLMLLDQNLQFTTSHKRRRSLLYSQTAREENPSGIQGEQDRLENVFEGIDTSESLKNPHEWFSESNPYQQTNRARDTYVFRGIAMKELANDSLTHENLSKGVLRKPSIELVKPPQELGSQRLAESQHVIASSSGTQKHLVSSQEDPQMMQFPYLSHHSEMVLPSHGESEVPVNSFVPSIQSERTGDFHAQSHQLQTNQVHASRDHQTFSALDKQVQPAHVGVSVPDQDPNCIVPDAAEKSVRNPVWTASYPGSGAKLTWKLIRAITGIFTGDDHDHNGRVEMGTIVAVKTHFPSHTPHEVFTKEKLKHIHRAVLLLRNPINAIPSYHNYVYEQQNGLLNHSTRAPVDAWIKWRNAFFSQELQAWVDHQKYWLNTYSSGALFIVSMEQLTSREMGPTTLHKLGQFIAGGESDIEESMVAPDKISCIWDMFVNSKVPGEMERRHSHRSGGPIEYPFTSEQFDQILCALKTLKNEYHDSIDLSVILDEYYASIQETKAKLDQL